MSELTGSTAALFAAASLATERDALQARVERLEKICAAAYQLAGVVGAPVRFLDALALHEDVDVEALLPVSVEECEPLPFWDTLIGANTIDINSDELKVTMAFKAREDLERALKHIGVPAEREAR